MYSPSMRIMFRYIKNYISINEYIDGFKKFINSLGNNKSDFEYFEANISAFYLSLFQDKENIHDLFLKGSECRGVAEDYINKITFDYTGNHYFNYVKSNHPQAAINEIW
jgi:hypothetical protein